MIGGDGRKLHGGAVFEVVAGVAPQSVVAAVEGAGKFIRPIVIEVGGNGLRVERQIGRIVGVGDFGLARLIILQRKMEISPERGK